MLDLTYTQIDKELGIRLSKFGLTAKFHNSVQQKNVLTNRNCLIDGFKKKVLLYTYNNKTNKVTQKPLIISAKYNDPKKAVLDKRGASTWGKTLEISRIGNTIDDVFDYIVFLLLQIVTEQKIYFSQEFPEGKLVEKLHKRRERNSKLIKSVKEKFYRKHGKLFCEVCGFDYASKYKSFCEGFIEGHHTIPLSQLNENSKTKDEDIILVCSNCHRMIHRYRPWLNKNELHKILK